MRPKLCPQAWTAVLSALVALALTCSSAQASVAHVAHRFGQGGVRYLPDFNALQGVALTGDGRVLVGSGREVYMLLPSGRLDPSFGSRGSAELSTGPRDDKEVGSISILTVDGDGRPVLVGPSGSTRTETVIERFTPEGRPDRSFGSGRGYTLVDLGLPEAETGVPPAGYVEDIEFDPAGRLFLVGSDLIGSRETSGKNGPSIESISEAFVARLTPSGRLDRSFAAGGLFRDEGTEFVRGRFAINEGLSREWSIEPDGGVAVFARPESKPLILRLSGGGVPDPRFGEGGYAAYPSGTDRGPLTDPKGRTIAWGYVQGVAHRLADGLRISRLGRTGSPDASFGRGGSTTLRVPRFYEADMALDERGRMLIAASLKGRGAVSEPKELVLLRLTADGELDRSFGSDGMVHVPPPRGKDPAVYLEGLDVRGDQAAIVSTDCADNCRQTVALIDLGDG